MKLLLAATAALLSAQALLAVPAAAACPNVGLATESVTFVTAKGRRTYRIEVAATPAQQECGLMYRKAMRRNVGMMFPFDPPKAATFWMENTPLPLDLVFVGPDNRVINVAPGKPYSRDIIASEGIAASVIELNAGEAKRIGLKPGDRVRR
ncbi:DUF192 domain-containing protein [Sandarakinorhabdus sp. DWP1-3-1]|uniref:DUF192 domain-containing protein n=1 Tax=Sandarakinorhabdus sp. DWP1-3-1 TaxID=2804627 RepID=UPI003CF471CB